MLNDNLSGKHILGCRLFPLRTLNTFCHLLPSGLQCFCREISLQPYDSLVTHSLFFSLFGGFKIPFSFWHFNCNMSWCRSVWVHLVWDPVIPVPVFFFRFEMFSAVSSSNTFSIPLSLSSPSGIPIMHRLAHYIVVIFYSFVFLSAVLIVWFPLFYLPDHFLHSFSFVFFFFYGHTCGIWKFLGLIQSCSWGLHHSHSSTGSKPYLWPAPQLWQHWILNPLSKAMDQPHILMDASHVH